jgi:hypothetical protein
MIGSLTDTDWHLLLRRIEAGSCTPLLGSGPRLRTLPLGAQYNAIFPRKRASASSSQKSSRRTSQSMVRRTSSARAGSWALLAYP